MKSLALTVFLVVVFGLPLSWAADPAPPPLFDILGAFQHPIITNSELAQRYFNQGLRLVYGFNHAEALRAFEHAARIDPRCAMAHWGQALALGPNINAPMDVERGRQVYGAMQQAIALARYASDYDRAYIEALATRYAAEPERADRNALNRAYAEAMRTLAERYPDDPPKPIPRNSWRLWRASWSAFLTISGPSTIMFTRSKPRPAPSALCPTPVGWAD